MRRKTEKDNEIHTGLKIHQEYITISVVTVYFAQVCQDRPQTPDHTHLCLLHVLCLCGKTTRDTIMKSWD